MNNPGIRYGILILILGLTAGLIRLLTYETYYKTEDGIQAVNHIPQSLGPWQGTNIPLGEEIFAILETRSIIHRTYSDNDRNVFLSLVYYPETKVDFHAPEGCLAGRGVQISKSRRRVTIDAKTKPLTFSVNQLLRQDGNRQELIYYFYKSGDFLGPSYIRLRIALALNKLTSSTKSGSLIRISTQIKNGNMSMAHSTLSYFLETLYPYLIQNL